MIKRCRPSRDRVKKIVDSEYVEVEVELNGSKCYLSAGGSSSTDVGMQWVDKVMISRARDTIGSTES